MTASRVICCRSRKSPTTCRISARRLSAVSAKWDEVKALVSNARRVTPLCMRGPDERCTGSRLASAAQALVGVALHNLQALASAMR